jgi:cobalt/nickel transport system ATP-binding protein
MDDRKDFCAPACHVCAGQSELIHVDCASHIYPDGSIGIHDLCFRVMEKEIIALCGANGSGKSTLLEHLNGLLQPSDGSISVLGRKLDAGTKKDLWKLVGIVFQRSDDQLFAPTVLDDVMFGPLNLGMSREDARKAAMESLNAVGAGGLINKIPSYLSGGQKRMVSIAGVLAMRPRIAAMDEPTSDLDPAHAEAIERIITGLKNGHGISVVIATHDLDMAARIADRVCIVKEGSIIAEGRPSDVFYDRDLLERAGLREPKIVRIYRELCRGKKTLPGRCPLTIEELVGCILKA